MLKEKVFCIGLSRTGTTSLCEALKTLGYKTLHFPLNLFVHPEIISEELSFKPHRKLGPYWAWRRKKELELLNASSKKGILNDYDAFGDLPIPFYYKALDEKFPGSKFIYTYRDEKKWLNSMKWLFDEGVVLWSQGLIGKEILLYAYKCIRYDEQALIQSYRSHHNNVMAYFSGRPQDLLRINIDQQNIDFKLLSDFLQVEAPEIGFPRVNAGKMATKKQHLNYWLGSKIPFYSIIIRKLYRP